MDLVTYALAKKYTDNNSSSSMSSVIPSIGENGNWFINGSDTGIRATQEQNVEVDGVLKVDTEKQELIVMKDGIETVVGNYTASIELTDINKLFKEE